jgi:hypothetical protein
MRLSKSFATFPVVAGYLVGLAPSCLGGIMGRASAQRHGS